MTARRTDGQREVMIATKLGMIIRFSEEEVRPMGRGAGGVRGIEVDEGDEVIAADVVQEGVLILTVTERGYGKRTPLEEYRLQGRAGKGIIDIKTGGRNGNVVGMLQVRDGDDILVVTTKGKIIRIHAADVSSQGRNTRGVRIIDLDADDRVGSIARVEAESARARRSAVAAVLDLRQIREQPDAVARALAAKGGAELVQVIVARDAERRRLLREAEELKALRNRASEAIGQAKRGEDAAAEQARMREVGERIKALDAELKAVDAGSRRCCSSSRTCRTRRCRRAKRGRQRRGPPLGHAARVRVHAEARTRRSARRSASSTSSARPRSPRRASPSCGAPRRGSSARSPSSCSTSTRASTATPRSGSRTS